MHIRNAVLDDASDITSLNSELGYSVSPAHLHGWLSDLVVSEEHCVVVAESEGRVVGWLVIEKRLSLESGYKAEITGLVVNQGFRRCGVAKQLVRAAEQWALNKKLSRIIVRSNVVRAESHHFYLSQDFIFTKTSHNYEKRIFDSAYKSAIEPLITG